MPLKYLSICFCMLFAGCSFLPKPAPDVVPVYGSSTGQMWCSMDGQPFAAEAACPSCLLKQEPAEMQKISCACGEAQSTALEIAGVALHPISILIGALIPLLF